MSLPLGLQIVYLLVAAGLLAFALATFHPEATELKAISEIQRLNAVEVT